VVATDFHGSIGYGQKLRSRSRATGRPRLRRRDARYGRRGEAAVRRSRSYLRGGRQLRRVYGGLDRGPHRSLQVPGLPRRRLRSGERVRIDRRALVPGLGVPRPPWRTRSCTGACRPAATSRTSRPRRWWSRASWTSAYPSSRAWNVHRTAAARIESRLLYFPDEGHWVLKPRNSQLWYHTVLDWIDAHARPGNKQASRP